MKRTTTNEYLPGESSKMNLWMSPKAKKQTSLAVNTSGRMEGNISRLWFVPLHTTYLRASLNRTRLIWYPSFCPAHSIAHGVCWETDRNSKQRNCMLISTPGIILHPLSAPTPWVVGRNAKENLHQQSRKKSSHGMWAATNVGCVFWCLDWPE